MPEFILETGGEVAAPVGVSRHWAEPLRFDQLNAFEQGYIEALFFTETEPQTTREERFTNRRMVRKTWEQRVEAGQQRDIPGDYGFGDLAPEALLYVIKDCASFKRRLRRDTDHPNGDPELWLALEELDEAGAGRDFWYTRNGHGCGFWDGDWPEPLGEELDRAARRFGEVDAYVGDDGKVYLS